MSTYKNAEGGKYPWENELSQHWKSKTIIWIARMRKIIAPVNWWEVYSPRNHLSWRKSECKGDETSYPLLGCYWSSPALLTFCSTSQLLSPPLFHITWVSNMLWFPIGTAFQASKLWVHILANPCTPNWCGTNGCKIIHLIISSSHFFFLR